MNTFEKYLCPHDLINENVFPLVFEIMLFTDLKYYLTSLLSTARNEIFQYLPTKKNFVAF